MSSLLRRKKMRVRISICLVAIVAVMTFGLADTASAFHGGGVAHCDGCHSMHQSLDNPISGAGNNQLLKGSDASSTCLNCHDGGGSYHINSVDGSNAKAGGDFYWISNPYSASNWSGTVWYGGDNSGHNIVAADYLMIADANPNNATAPGGTYPSANFSCTSCHDAHGRVSGSTAQAPISVSGSYGAADPTDGSIHGNYRILGGAGYVTQGVAFTAAAPVATANGSSGTSVDYGSGMSEFCANCHGDYINDSHRHPAGDGEHLNGYGTNYNSYVKTGDMTGTSATAYDPLISFERGVTDGSLLDETSTVGTDGNSNVMCLTCHRAHASAFNNAGRWDFETEFIGHSAALSSGDVPATAAVYYKNGTVIDVHTEYGEYQRSLCNKCHV
jgi:hypothetical protein